LTPWRWLDHAAAQGLPLRDGAGRKSDPFRFRLPEKDDELNKDITASPS